MNSLMDAQGKVWGKGHGGGHDTFQVYLCGTVYQGTAMQKLSKPCPLDFYGRFIIGMIDYTAIIIRPTQPSTSLIPRDVCGGREVASLNTLMMPGLSGNQPLS